MSDPVSNSDIEDVLSSIRRLVSEEPTLRKTKQAEDDPSVERLVLTPAFRIAEDGSEEASDMGEESAQLEEPLKLNDAIADDDDPRAEVVEATVLESDIDATLGQLDEDGEADHEAAAFAEDVALDIEEVEAIELFPKADESGAEQDNDLDHDRTEGGVAVATIEEEPEVAPAADDATSTVANSEADWTLPEEFETTEDWSQTPQEPAPKADDIVEAELGNILADTVEGAEETPPPHPNQMSLEERIAELEAAIEQSPQEWEPDGSEDGDDDETRPLSVDVAEKVERGTAESVDITEVVGGGTPLVELGESEIQEADVDSRAPMFSHSMEQVTASDDAKVDPSEPTESVEAEVVELHGETVPFAGSDTAAAWEYDDDSSDDEITQEPEEIVSTESLEQQGEADASPVDGKADDKSVDSGRDDTKGGDDDTENSNLLSEDLATIDEESLRDLISDLIRDELQGVLGERITRNVRRLVRREIQRALVVRDLE